MKRSLLPAVLCFCFLVGDPAFADEYTSSCVEPTEQDWRGGYSVWKPLSDAYTACLDAGFERRRKDEADRLARLKIEQEAKKILKDTMANGAKTAVRNVVARGINERAGITVIKEIPPSKLFLDTARSFEVALAVPAIGGRLLDGSDAPDPTFKMIEKLDTKMYSLAVPDPFAAGLFKTNIQIADRLNTQVVGQFSSVSKMVGYDRSWATDSFTPQWAASANTFSGNSFDDMVAADARRAEAEREQQQRAAERERQRVQAAAVNAAREKRREAERDEEDRQDRLQEFRELRVEREELARLTPPVPVYVPTFVPSTTSRAPAKSSSAPATGKLSEVGCSGGPCKW